MIGILGLFYCNCNKNCYTYSSVYRASTVLIHMRIKDGCNHHAMHFAKLLPRGFMAKSDNKHTEEEEDHNVHV